MKRESSEPLSLNITGDPRKKSRFKMALPNCYNEENAGEQWSGPASRAEVYQIPEILEILFQYVEESSIYNLRFVSKIWNYEVCQIIRKTADIVVRQEPSSNHDEFAQLLIKNRNLNLPLPFKKVTVWMDIWNGGLMDQIALDDRVNLHFKFFDTGMDARHGEIQRNLKKTLSTPSIGKKLLSLEFGCFKNPTMHLRLQQFKQSKKFNFPKLETLSFHGAIGSNATMDSLIDLMNSSPNMKKVSIGSETQQNYIIELFEKADMSCLAELQFDLSCGIIPSPRDFPNLRKLSTTLASYENDIEDIENFTVQRQIVEKFADSLYELDIQWNPKEANLSSIGFPYCPQLEKLTVHDWGSNIGAFNYQKLPNLKEICLYQDILNTDNAGISSVHPGVRHFRFNGGVLFPNDMIDNLQFIRFLRHVSIQFPLLNSLHLTWNMRPENLLIILQRFPRLETLQLNSHYGFPESIFTGVGTYPTRFQAYIRRPAAANDVTDRKPCLIDLRHLKTLVLEHAWNIKETPDIDPLTNNGIVNGIARIPSLQALCFQWNPNLTSPVLARLNHLKSITIIVDRNSTSKEMCTQLRNLWPLVKVIRVTRNNRRVSWMEWILSWIKSLVNFV